MSSPSLSIDFEPSGLWAESVLSSIVAEPALNGERMFFATSEAEDRSASVVPPDNESDDQANAIVTLEVGIEESCRIHDETSNLSWSNIDHSLIITDIGGMVQDIILQPGKKPWRDVSLLNPDFRQTVMDILQTALDHWPHMKSGLSRAAAIKCLQAISRVSDILPTDLVLRNIVRGNLITYGGFADIFEGVYQSQKVCLKALRVKSSYSNNKTDQMTKWFRHEALLWKQLRHPYILPFLGIVKDEVTNYHAICLISPWMANGNVEEFLMGHPTYDRLKMVLEITEGIEYLHTHDPQIVHADIRGANILVKDDYTCCLADFGVTMVIETRTPTRSRLGVGTDYWMSPEVWTRSDAHIPARDIYAFGCTVIEIYSGTHPFPDIPNFHHIFNEVVQKKRKPPRPDELDEEELWAIVDFCLVFEAELRPTATNILQMLRSFAQH